MRLSEHFADEAPVEVDEHATTSTALCDPGTNDHHVVRRDVTSRFGRLSHSGAQ
jgi:hypothetical protein